MDFLSAAIPAALSYVSSSKARKDAGNIARAAIEANKYRPYNVTSGIGSARFDGQNLVTSLNPRFAAIRDRFVGLGENQLGMLEDFNPTEFSQATYDRLRALSRPAEEQQRLDIENRLLSQGMLGSTGGMNRIQALNEAQSQADLQRELAAEQEARNQYNFLASSGQGMFTNALGLENIPSDYGQIGGSIGLAAGKVNTQGLQGFQNVQMAGLANAANVRQAGINLIGDYLGSDSFAKLTSQVSPYLRNAFGFGGTTSGTNTAPRQYTKGFG